MGAFSEEKVPSPKSHWNVVVAVSTTREVFAQTILEGAHITLGMAKSATTSWMLKSILTTPRLQLRLLFLGPTTPDVTGRSLRPPQLAQIA